MQALLDLGQSSPRTLSAHSMSHDCAALIVRDLLDGNFELTAWQQNFLADVQHHSAFTLPQKKVIYNLAFKLKIL